MNYYICSVLLIYNTMIEIKNLSFSYKRHQPIYTDFSMNLPAGVVCGLLGKNGTGKSTLLHLIAGLLTPSKGTVLFRHTNTRLRTTDVLSDLFLVPEEYRLPDLTMNEFVQLNAPFYPRFSHENLQNNLIQLGLDKQIRLDRLSMGQRKKAFLAFALACNTRLLLMDEPTNGLDIPSKSEFRKILSNAMDDEKSILISTHQVNDIDNLLDHVLILDNNRVVLNDSLAHISSRIAMVACSQVPEQAFYSQNAPIGHYALIPSDTDNETPINLELLFNAAISSPELIRYLRKEEA